MNLVLPWPPAILSPNARGHWTKKAKAVKLYRQACAWQAASQGAYHMADVQALRLTLEFVPPTRRAYDLDNALARMKSGLDGLADVLQVDDSRWDYAIKKAPAGEIGGFVRVFVEALT